MKKSKQKLNAYQMLLFNDEGLSEEKRMWMSLCKLEEGQDKLRKRFFKELSELKKENLTLKQDLWNVRKSMNEQDMFSDLFAIGS